MKANVRRGGWFKPGTAYITSLVFLFLPSQSLLPFFFFPWLSWPLWGYLRLTITATTHRGCSQHLEDSPLFLHLTCSQDWSRPGTDAAVFCSVPRPSHFGKAWGQMQMGSCKLELIQKNSFQSLFNSWVNVDSLTVCRQRSTHFCSTSNTFLPLALPCFCCNPTWCLPGKNDRVIHCLAAGAASEGLMAPVSAEKSASGAEVWLLAQKLWG